MFSVEQSPRDLLYSHTHIIMTCFLLHAITTISSIVLCIEAAVGFRRNGPRYLLSALRTLCASYSSQVSLTRRISLAGQRLILYCVLLLPDLDDAIRAAIETHLSAAKTSRSQANTQSHQKCSVGVNTSLISLCDISCNTSPPSPPVSISENMRVRNSDIFAQYIF